MGLLDFIRSEGQTLSDEAKSAATAVLNKIMPAAQTAPSKMTSYPPSSLYDIRANILQNKAANPPIPTLPTLQAAEPKFSPMEAFGSIAGSPAANAEEEVARNFKLNSLMQGLMGKIGTFSAGAILPPNLEALASKARAVRQGIEGTNLGA